MENCDDSEAVKSVWQLWKILTFFFYPEVSWNVDEFIKRGINKEIFIYVFKDRRWVNLHLNGKYSFLHVLY